MDFPVQTPPRMYPLQDEAFLPSMILKDGLSDGENISWNQEPCNDYSSGDSSSEISVPSSEDSSGSPEQPPSSSGSMVWIPATGEKYHSIPDCGRMNPAKASQITESEAISRGLWSGFRQQEKNTTAFLTADA